MGVVDASIKLQVLGNDATVSKCKFNENQHMSLLFSQIRYEFSIAKRVFLRGFAVVVLHLCR